LQVTSSPTDNSTSNTKSQVAAPATAWLLQVIRREADRQLISR
jgi:hypothetical protein